MSSKAAGGEAFGTLLRGHRAPAGLTQEELAELAGLSVRAVANWERGRARPRRHSWRFLLMRWRYRPGNGSFLVRRMSSAQVMAEYVGSVSLTPSVSHGESGICERAGRGVKHPDLPPLGRLHAVIGSTCESRYSGGFWLGVLLGSFDEFAVDEGPPARTRATPTGTSPDVRRVCLRLGSLGPLAAWRRTL